MPTVNLSPLGPKPQFMLSTGLPAVGAQLFFYVAGSNTKLTTYTDSTGAVGNANPIVLDALGEPSTQIWFQSALLYKIVFAPATDTDPPTSPIWTVDNVPGINDVTASADEWVASGLVPTYVDATHLTLVGDQTSTFQVGRRLKTAITAGTGYHTISASSFGAGITTVTVSGDSLDSGLSAVAYALLSATNPSIPVITQILDRNSNEVVKFGVTAAAVNEVTITNAATANSPSIVATGGDTNISLNLGAKGTGNVDFTTGGGSLIQASVRHTAGANRFVVITGSNGSNPSIGTNAGGLSLTSAAVFMTSVSTTGSAANCFLDPGDSNNVLRSTSAGKYKTQIEVIDPDIRRRVIDHSEPRWFVSLCPADKGKSFYGLIAEQIAQIDPRLVFWTYPRKTVIRPVEWEELNEAGEKVTRKDVVIEEVPDTSQPAVPDGVQYDRFIPFILDELRELRAMVNR